MIKSLLRPEKSEVVELRFDTGHISFTNTSILSKAPRCFDRFIKEVVEVKLHPRNFNRDRGFSLIRC
jgi:hypothetical protein